jgi:hypothetical protein
VRTSISKTSPFSKETQNGNKSSEKETNEARPGPKEERLVIQENWKDAVKRSFAKKKPSEGPAEILNSKTKKSVRSKTLLQVKLSN